MAYRRQEPRPCLPAAPALLPGREITCYWRGLSAILLPSERFTRVLDHHQAWLAGRDQLIAARRFCEGQPPQRAPG